MNALRYLPPASFMVIPCFSGGIAAGHTDEIELKLAEAANRKAGWIN